MKKVLLFLLFPSFVFAQAYKSQPTSDSLASSAQSNTGWTDNGVFVYTQSDGDTVFVGTGTTAYALRVKQNGTIIYQVDTTGNVAVQVASPGTSYKMQLGTDLYLAGSGYGATSNTLQAQFPRYSFSGNNNNYFLRDTSPNPDVIALNLATHDFVIREHTSQDILFRVAYSTGIITVDSTLVPDVDDENSLGTASLRWSDFYSVLTGGADFVYANGQRAYESELHEGYGRGFAFSLNDLTDENGERVAATKRPDLLDDEPLFAITEDFISYKGQRVTSLTLIPTLVKLLFIGLFIWCLTLTVVVIKKGQR